MNPKIIGSIVIILALMVVGYVFIRSPAGFELPFGSLESIAASGKTSATVASDRPLTIQVTVFTPDDPRGGGVEIKDLNTRKHCVTEGYLVERMSLSRNQKILSIYHYNGSNRYVTRVDTTTCESIGATQTFP